MLGKALESILRSRLGQYLDTDDLVVKVAFGQDIVLRNIKLKESALSDAGLPVRCVYGKIKELTIEIPWTSIYSEPTKIKVDGLYLLIVPSSDVPYNQEQEEKEKQESKMSKIAAIEEAKLARDSLTDKGGGEVSDTFFTKLLANIFKNLQVTCTNVHLRYEDTTTNEGHPFGMGVTLESLQIYTQDDLDSGDAKSSKDKKKTRSFKKKVELQSLAVYWQPNEKYIFSKYSTQNQDDVKDIQFDNKISRQSKKCDMNYLLGPIHFTSDMTWCPDPKRYNFEVPHEYDLNIDMKELCLSITKYQYHDFAMLLHSLNSMQIAARYRKYKAANNLEHVSNYKGRAKDLWGFVRDCVLEEEVRPKERNWSKQHIMNHLSLCREYRERYKDKLLGSTTKLNEERLAELEKKLDSFNITFSRERAELAANAKRKLDAENSGWFSWAWGKGKKDVPDSDISKLDKALTPEEKSKLYEAIGYQEDAEEGKLEYPKRFVKLKVKFELEGLQLTVRDEELNHDVILNLQLQTVDMELSQRPAASNFLLKLDMQQLTVTGVNKAQIIKTKRENEDFGRVNHLLHFEFETHPPKNRDPAGLDDDPGDIHDRRLHIKSSPLQLVWDTRTIYRLKGVFKLPEEVKISYLQESAMDSLREYKEVKMSQLGMEFVIQNHKFMDVNIELGSSYVIFPMHGSYKRGSACIVANVGSIAVRSGKVTQGMLDVKNKSKSLSERIQESFLDQPYDKFNVRLTNMELLLAQKEENWKEEIRNKDSKLFLLKPTTIEVDFKMCLIPNDPHLPVTKLDGILPKISICMEEKRVLTMVEILEDILDPDQEDIDIVIDQPSVLPRVDSDSSFVSASSSLHTTTSYIGRREAVVPAAKIPVKNVGKSDYNIVKLLLTFEIKKFDFEVQQNGEDLLKFELADLASKLTYRREFLQGEFSLGCTLCEYMKVKMPNGEPVKLLSTGSGTCPLNSANQLLKINLEKKGKNSPQWAGIKDSLTAVMSEVTICFHQDALIHFADEAAKIMKKVQSKAKKLMAQEEPSKLKGGDSTPGSSRTPGSESPILERQTLRRSGGRKMTRQWSRSGEVGTSMARSLYKPKAPLKKTMSKIKEEDIDLQLKMDFKGVAFKLMTSKHLFTEISAQNLKAEFKMTYSHKFISASLQDFKVLDESNKTYYKMIAESTGNEVFNTEITLYDEISEKDRDFMSDINVKISVGQLRFVFLMKWVNDLLEFVDPFTNAKKMIEDQAIEAYEASSKLVADAYKDATRIKLDVLLRAPVILVPKSSKSKHCFEANLGKLILKNHIHSKSHYARSILLDTMSFELTDMTMFRARIQEDERDNSLQGSCSILEPVSFKLEVTRNMEGTHTENDIPEIQVEGTLYSVNLQLSKEDWNTLIAMLTSNFGEKGLFEKPAAPAPPPRHVSKHTMHLPVKSRHSGSKMSLGSTKSQTPEKFNDFVKGKAPLAKMVEFKFTLQDFSIHIYEDTTDLSRVNSPRDPSKSLAKVKMKDLSVSGDLKMNGLLKATANLTEVYLEDAREHSSPSRSPEKRIVRLLETRKTDNEKSDMITVKYVRDVEDERESVDVSINSFTVVASMAYLIEISNFFVPEEVTEVWDSKHWYSDPDQEEFLDSGVVLTRTVKVKMEEPDIILVNNIEDINTQAIMLNTEFQMNLCQQGGKLTFSAIVEKLRGHTCKFNPAIRDKTLAEILQPTNLAMHYNSDADTNRTRIDININNLVLNVFPASIEILMHSYYTFMEHLKKKEEEAVTNLEEIPQDDDETTTLWETKKFKENEVWYLKPDDALDPLHSETMSLASTSSLMGDEQLVFNVNNFIVTLEVGTGNNTVPMILMESKISGDLRNWTTQMSLLSEMQLEVAYYNAKLALWEPVIEPVCKIYPNGVVSHKRWTLDLRYQVNSPRELGSALMSPNFDETDAFVVPEFLPPLTEINIVSKETLQICVTKTFVSVLDTLQKSFADLQKLDKKASGDHPFIIQNRSGKEITLMLGENKNFIFYHKDSHTHIAPSEVTQLRIECNEDMPLDLCMNRSTLEGARDYVSPLRSQTDQSEVLLKIRVGDESSKFLLPVNKADTRFFALPFRGDEIGVERGIVSEVSVVNGCKTVLLRSILSFKNHYPSDVCVWLETVQGGVSQLHTLQKGAVWYAPDSAAQCTSGSFHFSISGQKQSFGFPSFSWTELFNSGSSPGLEIRKSIKCCNTNGDPAVWLNVEGRRQEVFNGQSRDLNKVVYMIDIRPKIVIKNCLPVPIYFNTNIEKNFHTLDPGETGCLQDITFGQSMLHVKIFEWRNTDLIRRKILEENQPELDIWRFESVDASHSNAKLDLGVQKDESKGTVVLSLFAPFWLVNKTGMNLRVKGFDNQNEMTLNQQDEGPPMMFSYISKSFLGKKKISLKVDGSDTRRESLLQQMEETISERIEPSLWSDSFTIDTVGDAGKVTCKLDTRRGSLKKNFQKPKHVDAYSIGVQINQSKCSLTKLVTFIPYFMLYNTSQFVIELKEIEEELTWLSIQPGACVPFWPVFGGRAVVCRAAGLKEITVPFSLSDGQSSLLPLKNMYGGIFVSVKTDNVSETLVTLSSYKPGSAPALLVNNTPGWTIMYGEVDSDNRKFLAPGEKVLFTWEKPSGSRTLTWSIQNVKQVSNEENTLTSDGSKRIEVQQGNYSAVFSWVSFLDGMQRVLLFTTHSELADQLVRTTQTGESERIEMEIDVSIHGVGLSLVNNDEYVRRELAYLSVTSSDVVWEVRKEGKLRFKSLTTAQCQLIDKDWMIYSRMLAIGQNPPQHRNIEGDIVVNYVEERMYSPHKGKLRRQFQRGLWLQYRTSPHQKQIHVKINRVQLDNQLSECLYPVIAAPVPPPRSITATSFPKPFIEMSVLMYTSPEHNNMNQFKYIHALVQEMHLKIELGFLSAISELFEEEEILEEDIGQKLAIDLELSRKPLKDHATLKVSEGKKDFYDYLHLSPLKVHVSFSLTSYKANRSDVSTHRGSNFINLLLQTFGVTITDMNDIVFRLAFFERKHMFFNNGDLIDEMYRHYTTQAIKQMYVILLGLDVIGNPFGLAVGVARSVEDLFYEPFQGAVEGPSEFAEGLAIGVRSVLGGVVGGAAGTVSKITGTVARGLAVLTFDEKFQQKRRDAIKRRGNQNFGEGMARSGRDLVMGFWGGASGVIMKPVEGASKEGVGGFFKGVGKGVAGLVTRPTGGIIDFASGTFDSVKRVTEVGDELNRVRPARYIHPDGVIRYYDMKEAQGAKILQQLAKGIYALEDIYMLHEFTIAQKEVFLLTNKRLLYLTYNNVMGSWSVDWEFEFQAITGPPIVERDGNRWYLTILPKDERKKVLGLFGGQTGKKIFLPEGSTKDSAQFMARVIEDLRTGQNNFETVFINMILKKSKLVKGEN